MILSGHLGINDRADRAAASSMRAARLADIDARRRAAELTIDALSEAWRGSASRQQETGWQEVDDAARDVIDALSALLGALDLAREQTTGSDASVAVPRQTDRRARPWAPLPSDQMPGQVSSRPVRRSGT